MHSLPLSSVLLFFLKDKVTSLTTALLLLRSVQLLSVDADDIIGADTGRVVEFVVAKPANRRIYHYHLLLNKL